MDVESGKGKGVGYMGRCALSMDSSAWNREAARYVFVDEGMKWRGEFWAGTINVAVTSAWKVFKAMEVDEVIQEWPGRGGRRV